MEPLLGKRIRGRAGNRRNRWAAMPSFGGAHASICRGRIKRSKDDKHISAISDSMMSRK